MQPKVVKAFKHGGSVVVTIPAAFADALSIGSGDFIKVILKEDSLELEKVPLTDLR